MMPRESIGALRWSDFSDLNILRISIDLLKYGFESLLVLYLDNHGKVWSSRILPIKYQRFRKIQS